MENMNKNKCHSVLDTESHRVLKRQKGEMLNQVQHDVFFYKGAFTLIELLVVVLIIGILAAVAVPQYQKAVEKSRASEALPLLKSVYQSTQSYYLANGTYPTQFNELSIEVPWTGSVQWRNTRITDTRSNHLWSMQIYQETGFGTWLYLGRISGKYEGTGFAISMETGEMKCVEKTHEGKVFNGSKGDYCVKIMRTGTSCTSLNSGRYYPLNN